jgi:hypothetical protein
MIDYCMLNCGIIDQNGIARVAQKERGKRERL